MVDDGGDNMKIELISKFSEEDLQDIGEMILDEINIKLFNAEPTNQKVFQIYNELVFAGYKEKNKTLACNKIKAFFEKRTARNQAKEFYQIFGIPFDDQVREHMTLSYRTCEIPFETIKEVAHKTHQILSKLDVVHQFNVDEKVLIGALTELYNPKYYENEWRISISSLSSKIKKIVLRKGNGEFADQIEDVFNLLTPGFVKINNQQESLLKDGPGYVDGETLLTRKNAIKESEMEFVKFTLELINSDEVPEFLIDELFQSDDRHPLVRNFLSYTKNYNLLIFDKERSTIEVLSELKIVVKGLREIGEEILRAYHEVIQEKADQLLNEVQYI